MAGFGSPFTEMVNQLCVEQTKLMARPRPPVESRNNSCEGDQDQDREEEVESEDESDEESGTEFESEIKDEDSDDRASINQSRRNENIVSVAPFRPLPIPAILRSMAAMSRLPTPPPQTQPRPQPMCPPWSSLSAQERQALYVPDLIPDCSAPAIVRLASPSPLLRTTPRRVFRPCFGASCPVGCTLDRHEAIEREEEERRRRETNWMMGRGWDVVDGPKDINVNWNESSRGARPLIDQRPLRNEAGNRVRYGFREMLLRGR